MDALGENKCVPFFRLFPRLIKQWLKAPVVEEDEKGRCRWAGGKRTRRGTPQAGVISPLLANVYLHVLDRVWERHDLERCYGARLVRYCDDFVVLCKSGVDKLLVVIHTVLERLGLQLNEEKTHVVDARTTGFTFLGFSFDARCSRRSGKHYPHVQPSKQSIRRIKAEAKRLTDRRLTPIPMPVVVARLNLALRGWSNYFHHRNCSAVFSRLRGYAEERLRSHLCNRHQVALYRGGLKRFPRPRLYREYGLYKLPVTAPWVTAHALR